MEQAVDGSLDAFEETNGKTEERIAKEVRELVLCTHDHISFAYILWPLLGSLFTVGIIAVSMSAIPMHDVIKVILAMWMFCILISLKHTTTIIFPFYVLRFQYHTALLCLA